jgi:hypothetical protein
MPNSFRRTAVVVCFLGVLLAISVSVFGAEALRRVPLYRTGSPSSSYLHMAVRNVYGNAASAPEIVGCTASGGAFALTYTGPATYRPVWYAQATGCAAIAVGDVNGDGANEVVVGTTPGSGVYGVPGTLQVYDPRGFGNPRASVTIPGTLGISAVAVGNADSDAGLEIVVATTANTYIYDAATLTLEWTATGRGGTFVAIADVENDGVPEIILNGSGDGQVLNGVTHAFKWGYAGGFGTYVAVGDIDADGKAEIVGTDSNNVRVVQGDTLTTSSFSTTSYSLSSIGVGDGNGDGHDEILIGDSSYGQVRGYSSSGTQLWTVTNPLYGSSAVGAGDFDGDGASEVLWASGDSYNNGITIADPPTNTIEWSSTGLSGPFATAIADLDGDGRQDFVVAATATYSNTSRVEIHDLNGNMTWFPTSSSSTNPTRMAVGQLDSDPALEIVLLQGSYQPRISVYDGVTHELEWYSTTMNLSSNILLVRNVDGDAMDEIIVSTSDNKIEVLDGASPFVQNISPALNQTIYSAAIADIDGDHALEMIVGTSSGFSVLAMSDLSERLHAETNHYVSNIAATDGEFALMLDSQTLVSYSGSTLQEQWRCPSTSGAYALHYATLSGAKWLASSNSLNVQLFPTGGAACPTAAGAEYVLPNVSDLHFADINGDGTDELLAGAPNQAEIDLIALASAPRGDADNDGVVSDADMDSVARYFFGDGTIPAAGADANGDSTLRADDLLYLINYRRGTGPAPPQ